MKVRAQIPGVKNATNFNVVADSKTPVGSTLENLKAAIAGETAAYTKYMTFAKAAREQGYEQAARLFEATAAAELIHIDLEYTLGAQMDPDYEKPAVQAPASYSCDLNLISGANGEIYETSDMYPAFIKKAQEEGNNKAVAVFTRAKLAEAVHAELYLGAYNDLDAPDADRFHLCPVCGYIHKGEDFEKCPICFRLKDSFTAY